MSPPSATASSNTTILSAVSDRNSARYSLFSTAPSLGPSLAPTMESTSTVTNEKAVDSARNTMTEPVQLKLNNDTASRSASTASSQDARAAELRAWAATIERLSDQRLERQRFVPTTKKNDEIATNAIGAKLERALGHRMSGQDAVFKRRPVNEKSPWAAAAS